MMNIFTESAKTYSDNKKLKRPLNLPIYQSTIFQFKSSSSLGINFKEGKDDVYTRFGHPNLTAVAQRIALLEHAEDGLVFSSGMAAITTSLFSFLKSGDHIIAQREIFAQTFNFLEMLNESFGIEVDYVDAKNSDIITSKLKKNTRIIYIESPSNPVLDVIDIAIVAEIGKKHDVLVIIDSTFGTPFCQTPLDLGASLVIHSASKFLSGHSDVMGGAVVGTRELIKPIREMQVILGGIMDPHASWLLFRGMKTLAIRMDKICSNALAVAQFLVNQSCIKRVNYPFLEENPALNIAKSQMSGGGGVVSFEVKGGLKSARLFLDSLQMIPIATSLGGSETMIEIPYELDFSTEELGEDAFNDRAINPGFIRLSVGIENIDDILMDLSNGCEALLNEKETKYLNN